MARNFVLQGQKIIYNGRTHAVDYDRLAQHYEVSYADGTAVPTPEAKAVFAYVRAATILERIDPAIMDAFESRIATLRDAWAGEAALDLISVFVDDLGAALAGQIAPFVRAVRGPEELANILVENAGGLTKLATEALPAVIALWAGKEGIAELRAAVSRWDRLRGLDTWDGAAIKRLYEKTLEGLARQGLATSALEAVTDLDRSWKDEASDLLRRFVSGFGWRTVEAALTRWA